MISSFFQEKDLKNAYVISLINCKTTQIHNAAPDLSKIYVKWGASSMSYEFPNAFKDKLRFADPELQARVEALLKEPPPPPIKKSAASPPPIVSTPHLPSRPTAQPHWVEKKEINGELSASMRQDKKLKPYFYYGSNAHDIYLHGCEVLNWDPKKASQFNMLTKLYATNATPEGYSVWFLVHHSWIEKVENCKERWWNTIGSDIIYEDWICSRLAADDPQNFKHDHSKRLTFAKGKNGQYYYIGIFEPLGRIENRLNHGSGGGLFHSKVYRRIG